MGEKVTEGMRTYIDKITTIEKEILLFNKEKYAEMEVDLRDSKGDIIALEKTNE